MNRNCFQVCRLVSHFFPTREMSFPLINKVKNAYKWKKEYVVMFRHVDVQFVSQPGLVNPFYWNWNTQSEKYIQIHGMRATFQIGIEILAAHFPSSPIALTQYDFDRRQSRIVSD